MHYVAHAVKLLSIFSLFYCACYCFRFTIGVPILQPGQLTMSRLTQKDMTESEQRQLKTLLDQERKKHGRPLTNSEYNHIKDDYIDTLMAERESIAKQLHTTKKKKVKFKPDISKTYSWSSHTNVRGYR